MINLSLLDSEDYHEFRSALNGSGEDWDTTKVSLCHEFHWTSEQFDNQSLDFIHKCMIFLDEVSKKNKQAKK